MSITHWNNRKQKAKCNEDVNCWYTSNRRHVKKITKVVIWTEFPEKSNLFESREIEREKNDSNWGLSQFLLVFFFVFFCKSSAREMESITTKLSEKWFSQKSYMIRAMERGYRSSFEIRQCLCEIRLCHFHLHLHLHLFSCSAPANISEYNGFSRRFMRYQHSILTLIEMFLTSFSWFAFAIFIEVDQTCLLYAI